MLPPNLKTAILEFIGNEFQLDPAAIGEDLSFTSDLNLDPSSLSGLLQRMQDALDFTLPEDKLPAITTIEELFSALEPESPDETPKI